MIQSSLVVNLTLVLHMLILFLFHENAEDTLSYKLYVPVLINLYVFNALLPLSHPLVSYSSYICFFTLNGCRFSAWNYSSSRKQDGRFCF